MSVSYATIIRKLSEQVTLAEQVKEDPKLLKRHISQAKLLCELILDEQMTNPNVSEEKPQPMTDLSEHRAQSHSHSVKTDDLTGDSIFDF